MHSECTGTQRKAQVCTGAHGSAQERRIIPDKGHREHPINKLMSTHLPSAVVVDAVIFFVMFLRRFLNKNSTSKFLTHN